MQRPISRRPVYCTRKARNQDLDASLICDLTTTIYDSILGASALDPVSFSHFRPLHAVNQYGSGGTKSKAKDWQRSQKPLMGGWYAPIPSSSSSHAKPRKPDAARFGQNYLSKFGWDASKGLGAEGEGRTSALKVAQKLDMLGIGAAHQKDPNGIAWKQNKDFENLLRRLNAADGDGEGEVKTNVSGFSRAVESNLEGATNGVASMTVVEVKEEIMKDIDEGEKKKKSKKEKKSKKDKEGKRKRSEEEDEEKDSKKFKTVEETPSPPAEAEAPLKRLFVPRHRACVSFYTLPTTKLTLHAVTEHEPSPLNPSPPNRQYIYLKS